jgi:hypothetical protein
LRLRSSFLAGSEREPDEYDATQERGECWQTPVSPEGRINAACRPWLRRRLDQRTRHQEGAWANIPAKCNKPICFSPISTEPAISSNASSQRATKSSPPTTSHSFSLRQSGCGSALMSPRPNIHISNLTTPRKLATHGMMARADRTAIRQAGSTTGFRALLWCFARCAMPKRDSLSERLKTLIDFVSRPKEQLFSFAALVGQPPTPPSMKSNLSDPKLWFVVAREALKLQSGTLSYDPCLARAFETLKLDPADPGDWRLLASYLARVAFPEPKLGGRPKEWDAKRYCKLLEEIDRSKSKRPGRSDREACASIAKKSDLFFERVGAEALRKALKKARSHKKNEAIKYLLELQLPAARKKIEAAGGQWDSITEDLYFDQFQRETADWIGARWRGEKTS